MESSMSESVQGRKESGNDEWNEILHEINQYFNTGDRVAFKKFIKGNELKIILSKFLYNFDIDDIIKISEDYGFEVKYHKTIENVKMFSAMKDAIVLKYTQNRRGPILPAKATVEKKLACADYNAYQHVSEIASKLKERFDVIVRPDGDIDVTRTLRNHDQYKLTEKDAFEFLEKMEKR